MVKGDETIILFNPIQQCPVSLLHSTYPLAQGVFLAPLLILGGPSGALRAGGGKVFAFDSVLILKIDENQRQPPLTPP